MNESDVNFSDLSLFLSVAQCGSLSEAALKTNVPLPTLSRRMGRFEQTTGRKLFLRGRAGYALTVDGQALADELSGLDDIRRRYATWLNGTDGPAQVRITAGVWTSRYLAMRLTNTALSLWTPVFAPSNALLDLARREADIGLRSAPPDHKWLARQRLRNITYAVYGISDDIDGFVTLPATANLPPSQTWLHKHHADDIKTTAEDVRLCLDLALAGHGRILLPSFTGDAEPGLIKLSEPIEELTHEEWLVSHQDARNEPPIRAALTAIASTLTQTN